MTSTRYREDAATIFDVFCEVGAPESSNKLPPLLTKYPEDFNDPAILKSIQQFAFPCSMKDSAENDAVQLFSFVLTDSQSKYSFGFCRYTPRNDTCICLLSAFFWPNVFHKALNDISLVMNAGSQNDMETILTRIYHTDIPNPGNVIRFNLPNSNQTFEAKVPDLTKLPSLREDKYMLEFYNAVSPRQLIALYSSLLKERRIIFTGKKLSQLSSCIHACSKLLFPMSWQSVFIPVLPACLSDMVMAPMPYLIGVPKQVLDIKKLKDVGDVVVIDVDEKTLESPFDDVASMPNEVVSFLKSQLKATTDMNDSFARIFLRTSVILFGDYRNGFVRNSSGKTVWDNDNFISEQKGSYQLFLSSLLGAEGVQYLERFIHDRIDLMNQGVAPMDEFELEIESMDHRNNPVRENASDVLGALKDKVSGIQFTNKLNKLTPREIRKVASRKKTTGFDFQPMSFDNVEWEKRSNGSSDVSPSEGKKEEVEVSTPKTVPVANLIDFESPVSSQAPAFADSLKPTSFKQIPFKKPLDVRTNVFTDPFSLLDSPLRPNGPSTAHYNNASTSSLPALQKGWEKFD